MRKSTMICAAISSALLGACAPPGVDVEAERASLRATADAYHEAAQTVDMDTFVGFHADDTVVLPPNAPGEAGLEGARNFATAFTELPGFSIRFDNLRVGVADSGDMGYTLADAVIVLEGPDGAPVEDKVRDFHLWKKQDGEWKLSIDIWNSELPLPGAAATSSAATGNNAIVADPEHYTVEFENDRVRIVRVNYGPGEKSVMHTHGPNVAVFVSDISGRFNMPDGSAVDITAAAGETQWSDGDEHLPENLGDESLEVVLVELKD